MRFYSNQPKKSKLLLKMLSPIIFLLVVFGYLNSGVLYRSLVKVNMYSSYTTFLDTKFHFVEFFSLKKDSLVKRGDLVVKMSPTNYVNLQKERAKKTTNYILNDAIIDVKAMDSIENTYYKAKVRLGSKTSNSKLKLFGLYPDHFGDSDGHSFRLKFNGGTDFGKKKVNVLKPITRSFNLDRLINIVFKKGFKGLAIHSVPVNVIFNKKKYGIYLIEDFFDKYFIEENLNRESLLFEITNNKARFNHIPKNEKFLEEQAVIEELVSNSDFNSFFKLINEDKLFGFMAFTLIMNNNHSALDINVHWYYNSLTNSFEPTIRETKIKTITEDIPEEKFNIKLKSILGRKNKVLTDWMSSMSAVKFNRGISKALREIEIQFRYTLKDSNYINFKNKLIGFNSEMIKNEKLFYNNIQKLKRKKLVAPVGLTKVIRITKDTIISKDMLINKDTSLVIKAGTKVVFTNDANLIVKQGKLIVNGTLENKVQFIADKKSASSIYINTQKEINIQYASFANLSALNKGLWKLPSSITVFESKAVFSNCEFLENRTGDDMINIYACKEVAFKNCVFTNIKSDAIDSDFSKATISNCVFTKIGNDAVDGSGSDLSIENNVFEYVEDKVISAGEKSKFSTKSNIIKNSELGLVSKDGSYLISEKDQLINNVIDIVLFKKKPIYQYPKLELIDTKVYSNLIEKGCNFKGIKDPVFAKKIHKKLYGNRYGKATE